MQQGTLHHGELVTDAIDIEGRARITQLSTSTSGAQTAVLAEGIYDVWASADTFIKIAATASDVTTSTGYLLRANNTVSIFIRAGSRIGAILASSTGTLDAHMVG